MPLDKQNYISVEDLGENVTGLYVLLSQYAHGHDFALHHYRTNYGGEAVYAHAVTPRQWVLPLRLAWEAVRFSMFGIFSVYDIAVTTAHDRSHQQIVDRLDLLGLRTD